MFLELWPIQWRRRLDPAKYPCNNSLGRLPDRPDSRQYRLEYRIQPDGADRWRRSVSSNHGGERNDVLKA